MFNILNNLTTDQAWFMIAAPMNESSIHFLGHLFKTQPTELPPAEHSPQEPVPEAPIPSVEVPVTVRAK